MPTANSTHRKQLARAYAARSGLPYATALAAVVAASEAGRLPDRLGTAAAQAAALEALVAAPPERPARSGAAVPDVTGLPRATPGDLLAVADALLAAGAVKWSWHTGPYAGSGGVREVAPHLTDDGDLVFRGALPGAEDPVAEELTLNLDYTEDPDKAARHRIHTDPAGVTLCEPDGTPRATYRVATSSTSAEDEGGSVPAAAGLGRGTAWLLSGPHTTTLYQGETNRRTSPRCDVCNRKLGAGEPWWLVAAAGRGWANDAGVVCAEHDPDRLPARRGR